MAVRELVENSFDACEMAGTLPEVYVRISAENISPEFPEP
jgi:DNA topoisomerase VI subunit B